MKKVVSLFSFILLSNLLFANGLNISNVSFDENTNTIDFTVSWDNSWYDTSGSDDMYDGVWLFVKYAPSGGENWHHADMTSVSSSDYSFVSSDDKGVIANSAELTFKANNFVENHGKFHNYGTIYGLNLSTNAIQNLVGGEIRLFSGSQLLIN